MHKVLGVIPARYGSTRLAAKALADINGKPMVQRVYEQASISLLIDDVVVATDDKRIYDIVRRFGGKAVLTSKKHKSGTDRIGEVAKKKEFRKYDIVVNIQGDEPFIDPKNIDRAISPMFEHKDVNVSTLAISVKDAKTINDPNIVKVIFDDNSDAIYFSRCPVPYKRDKSKNVKHYKHIGLYVYRREYLMKLIRMKQGKLEKAEKLEQLRILENSGKIRVVMTKKDSISVDTKEDLRRIRKLKK